MLPSVVFKLKRHSFVLWENFSDRVIPIRFMKSKLIQLVGVLSCLVVIACGDSERVTVDEATVFVEGAELRLLDLWKESGRAAWIQNNFISYDTNAMSASASEKVMAATINLAAEAARFNDIELPPQLSRKMLKLKTSLAAVAPSNNDLQAELAEIMTEMESIYGTGEYCRPEEGCLSLPAMERLFGELRDTDELLAMWGGWRKVGRDIRPLYEKFVEISNAGAKELGFQDTGHMWRSGYDMPPELFVEEIEGLWEEIRPLYESLHCHVRAKLGEELGTAVVPPNEPIPAHLLGNMWGQGWGNIYDVVKPEQDGMNYDLTQLLERKGIDEVEMVRYGEGFFSSLGFEPLPDSFWERSLFVKPLDRDVVCHASAWNLDFRDDIRIKMCISITDDDFVTIHHELGHNYYQRAYKDQDPFFQGSANDGFHEGVGDTIALSITPEYLVKVGLLETAPDQRGDIAFLLRQALEKVVFLPFGLLVDQWRWDVFSGEIPPTEYNREWWELREKYQGVRPPMPRIGDDFDPGAKYHIPANTPYARYFLAHVLQFQFHRALCEAAGFEGSLHRCSIFESREAGDRLRSMLEMGASRPWPDALEVMTGTREMDATAILDYFAPLAAWLEEQNVDRMCGW